MRQRKGKPDATAAPGRDGLAAILRDPGTSTPGGRRDTALPAVPCDGAARVSEPCGAAPRDLRSGDPAVVAPRGRGRVAGARDRRPAKGTRVGAHPGLGPRDLDKPPFPNPRGDHPARAGVADILARHADGARKSGADIPEGVSPHSFRHQGAIGLPGSGASPVHMRDPPGRGGVTTTGARATAGAARGRELPGRAATAPRVGEYPDRAADKDPMAWPKALCRHGVMQGDAAAASEWPAAAARSPT